MEHYVLIKSLCAESITSYPEKHVSLCENDILFWSFDELWMGKWFLRYLYKKVLSSGRYKYIRINDACFLLLLLLRTYRFYCVYENLYDYFFFWLLRLFHLEIENMLPTVELQQTLPVPRSVVFFKSRQTLHTCVYFEYMDKN